MKKNIETILCILKELNYILTSKQKREVASLVIVLIISSLFELLGVTAILPFVQVILTPEKLFHNERVRPIIDLFGITRPQDLMLLFGIGIMLLYIIKNAYMIFGYYVQYNFATKVQKELSVKMLRSYMSRPYTYFLDVNSAEILRGCSTDTSNVYNILDYLCGIVTETLAMVMIGSFIIYTDPTIALGCLLLMGIVMLGMIVLFKPASKKAGNKFWAASALKSKAIYQAVSGVKEIYVLQRKNLFLRAYEESSETLRKAQRTNSLLNSCPERIIEGICVSGLIGIVCVRLVANDNMAEFVPKLAMFAMAAFKLLPSIGKITSRINGLVFCRTSLASVYSIIKEADEFEREHIQYVQNHGDIKESPDLQFDNKLTIQDIVWKYANQNAPVLNGTSLEIEKGQSVALIGASGAGKTTLADIILGLLHPQQGSICMDGMDVYAMPITWAHIVGYVPQAVFLTDDTVRNNVAFGLLENEIDDMRIWNALERAQLKGFVESLPKGLDTIVGERGIKFSGGQKQRIAIARALYNEPEILILDEATAALDNETELAVMESIEALQGQITMIIVAHRLTTIRKCDVIYEIRDGMAVKLDKEQFWKKIDGK